MLRKIIILTMFILIGSAAAFAQVDQDSYLRDDNETPLERCLRMAEELGKIVRCFDYQNLPDCPKESIYIIDRENRDYPCRIIDEDEREEPREPREPRRQPACCERSDIEKSYDREFREYSNVYRDFTEPR